MGAGARASRNPVLKGFKRLSTWKGHKGADTRKGLRREEEASK